MRLKNTNSILTILYLLLFAPLLTFSQGDQKNPLAIAIQAFDNKNYEEAELLFKAILNEKPDDFMVNYFYGACRTENNYFTNNDLECLIKANQEVSPINIDYYFGTQYHARSNWERALKFYNKFNSSAKLVGEEKNSLLSKIQQCYDKINPYEKYMVSEELVLSTDTTATNIITTIDSLNLAKQTEQTDSITNTVSEIELIQPLVESETEDIMPKGESINFKINNDILYLYTSQFKTENGKILFEQGNTKQKELNDALGRSESLRLKYKNIYSAPEKKLIGQEILSLENTTYSLKKEVATLFHQAKNSENEYWDNADSDEINAFQKEMDRINQIITNQSGIDKETESNPTTYIDPNILLGNKEVMAPSTEEESINNELVYKIQLGAYSRGLPDYIKRIHKRLSYIRKIENYTDEKGIVVYTTGNLSNLEDAEKMKKQVRQEGVEGASVVPYFKGKRITLAQAKDLQTK
jgi:hypothetical protein